MTSREFVDEDTEMGVDDIVFCTDCEIDLKREGNFVRHVESEFLHTLHRGSIPHSVADFTCSNSEPRICYDGFCHGMFRLNKIHLFFR